MNLKDTNVKTTYFWVAYFIQEGLDTDNYKIKVVDLERVREVVCYLGKVTNHNFNHQNLHYYKSLTTEYVEMTFLNLKNLSINYFNEIDLFIDEVDDVFYMLDRAEQLTKNK